MAKQTIYDFIRDWFDFSFENPDIVTPTHTAMYLWQVELNNRMGWVEKFGSPARQTMDAIGLKSYNTYIKIFKNLCEWGFIIMVKEAKNQYQACIIALSKINKAQVKALDRALISPIKNYIGTVQSTGESTIQGTVQSTHQSTDSIITQNTNRQIDQIQDRAPALSNFDIPEISLTRGSHCPTWEAVLECFMRMGASTEKAYEFFVYWEGLGWMKGITPISNFSSFANRWLANPISQAEKKPEGRKVIITHNMSGEEETWTEAEYEQYRNNPTASGYKFERYEL